MKKFIMIMSIALVTSCGTSKMLNTTSVSPFNIKEYQDTETEYRAYGIGTSPNIQLRRVEAVNDALSQISMKVNSDVITAFEDYTQQISYKDTIAVQKMVESYHKSVSASNLKGWELINEGIYNNQYHIIVSIDKEKVLREKVNVLNKTTYDNLKFELMDDKSSFIEKQNIK